MSETMLTGDSRERGPCVRCGRLGHDDARSRRCIERRAPPEMPIPRSAAAYDVMPGVVDVDPPSPVCHPAAALGVAPDVSPGGAVIAAPVSVTRVFAREIVSIAREISDRKAEIEVLEMKLVRATADYNGALADEIIDRVVAQLPRSASSAAPDYACEFPLRGAPAIVAEMAVHGIVALGWFAAADARAGVLRVSAAPPQTMQITREASS